MGMKLRSQCRRIRLEVHRLWPSVITPLATATSVLDLNLKFISERCRGPIILYSEGILISSTNVPCQLKVVTMC